MPRTKQRTPELRASVLVAGLAVLEREGVAGFTTRRVAAEAPTSTAAVYELFGDRAGLLRAMLFEGFRLLADALDELPETDDPRADVERLVAAYRRFALARPALAELMFSRPFADLDPGPGDLAAGAAVRQHVVGRVRRCVEAGLVGGDPTDVGHVVLATAQGLAVQEAAGWLGTTKRSIDRRWMSAVRGFFDGL